LLQVDGASLNFASHGGYGPWVTLVNGHSRSMDDFKSMTQFLVELGFRVATLDNRGSGKTTVTRPFYLKDMMTDVTSLWFHLGISQSHLIGISMGGVIAQNIAAAYPGCVDSLVLVSTTCGKKWMSHTELDWGTDLNSVKKKLSYYVTPRFISKNQLLFESMSKQILKSIELSDFKDSGSMQTAAIGDYDTLAVMPEINSRTLVVHGSDDQIINVGVVEDFKKHIGDVREVVFEEIGHLILAENPRPFYQLVGSFLKEI